MGLTAQLQAIIKEISKTYLFKNTFDLQGYITDLNPYVDAYQYFLNSLFEVNTISKDKLVQRMELIHACKKAIALLADTKTDDKAELQEVSKTICEDESFALHLPKLECDLKLLVLSINSMCKKPFRDKRKLPKSRVKPIILRLAVIFHMGTGNQPICNHNQTTEEYSGNFYDFLLDLEPVLKQIGISVGNEGTTGKYAFEQTRNYKKLLKETGINLKTIWE